MYSLSKIFEKLTKQLANIVRSLTKSLIFHFNTEYHRALESTLNTEWGSKADDDAYKHL